MPTGTVGSTTHCEVCRSDGQTQQDIILFSYERIAVVAVPSGCVHQSLLQKCVGHCVCLIIRKKVPLRSSGDIATITGGHPECNVVVIAIGQYCLHLRHTTTEGLRKKSIGHWKSSSQLKSIKKFRQNRQKYHPLLAVGRSIHMSPRPARCHGLLSSAGLGFGGTKSGENASQDWNRSLLFTEGAY